MSETPKCPLCKTSKYVRVNGPKDYTCLDCKMDFDGVDDGTVGYGRPEKYAERAERRQQKETLRQRNKRVVEIWR